MKRKPGAGYSISAYLYLLPAAALMFVFVFLPLFQSLGYSFFRIRNMRPDRFVGLENYKVLFADSIFWNSIRITIQWAFMAAIVPGFVGLILALLLEFRTKNMVLSGITRTVLFMPMMMSGVAVGLLWSLIYNPSMGIINAVMTRLGLSSLANPVNLLGNGTTALFAAFFTTVWQTSGLSMVTFSAALQNVSDDIIEASMIDGAGKIQQIRHISIPSIVGSITTIITINLISGFKAFDILMVLTGGGPGTSTLSTSLYMYRQGFFALKFDYAAVMQVMLFVCVIIFVMVFNFLLNKVNERYT
ncbi:MAG: sugar ABC transporter permease [Treponema sp.]|jgi:ABC-type sugar transport system permease subunit|nr:sugar ABC transporter permease [Treponema sp.]